MLLFVVLETLELLLELVGVMLVLMLLVEVAEALLNES